MLILLPKEMYRKIDTENIMTCKGKIKIISTSSTLHQLKVGTVWRRIK